MQHYTENLLIVHSRSNLPRLSIDRALVWKGTVLILRNVSFERARKQGWDSLEVSENRNNPSLIVTEILKHGRAVVSFTDIYRYDQSHEG